MREHRHCTTSYAFRARNPVSVETAFPLLALGQGRGGDSTHEGPLFHSRRWKRLCTAQPRQRVVRVRGTWILSGFHLTDDLILRAQKYMTPYSCAASESEVRDSGFFRDLRKAWLARINTAYPSNLGDHGALERATLCSDSSTSFRLRKLDIQGP